MQIHAEQNTILNRKFLVTRVSINTDLVLDTT